MDVLLPSTGLIFTGLYYTSVMLLCCVL